jgi:hypothetical protein
MSKLFVVVLLLLLVSCQNKTKYVFNNGGFAVVDNNLGYYDRYEAKSQALALAKSNGGLKAIIVNKDTIYNHSK